MAEVECTRCGATSAGLERAPLPGEPGRQVFEQTCRACWDEWKGVQVKLINEYRLSVLDPEHYARLIREMTAFLNLQQEESTDE